MTASRHEYVLLPASRADGADAAGGEAARRDARALLPDDEALEETVTLCEAEAERVDPDVVTGLYQRGMLALGGHAVGGLAVVFFYAGHAPSRLLAGWLIVFLAGWLLRAWGVQEARDFRTLPAAVLGRAHRRWELNTVASGVIWGLAVALLFPYGGTLHRLGLVLVVVSYCLASPATSYAVYLLYAAACFLPIVVHLAFSGYPHSEALAAGMAGVFVATLLVARQDQRLFERLHALKRRDARLARQLETERNAAQAARAQAEAANLAKSRLFAAASHDLRQPLHAMAIFTRSLAHHPLDDAAARLVVSVDDAVQAMERLFDQILDLERIDSGELRLEVQDVLLEDVFRRVRVHVEAVAFDKGLALTFRGGQHRVQTDPLLLERVLRNLVANAIRYTEDGGVLVGARRRGRECWLQVWDTGIGIEAAALPAVFDEFYQLDAARRPETGEYRGLGLGLSIVRRLLDRMGVPLTVRTSRGHGTMFSLALPRCDVSGGATQGDRASVTSASPVAHVASGPEASGWRERLTLVGRRIAVVESDAAEARQVVDLLRQWGAQVDAYASAVDYQAAGPGGARVDLLIVGGAGAEAHPGPALVAWAGRQAGRDVPAILLVTAGPMDAGADGWHRLVKPVQANRLRALVAYELAAGSQSPH